MENACPYVCPTCTFPWHLYALKNFHNEYEFHTNEKNAIESYEYCVDTYEEYWYCKRNNIIPYDVEYVMEAPELKRYILYSENSEYEYDSTYFNRVWI